MSRLLLSKQSPTTLAMVGMFLAAAAQARTELTFGGFTFDNIEIWEWQVNYGGAASATTVDYTVSIGTTGVEGTPEIALGWGFGLETYSSWDGRGQVAQIDFTLTASPYRELRFEPARPPIGVLINSFYLDELTGGGDQNVDWEIYDSTGTLASGNWTRNSSGRDLIETGLAVEDVHVGEDVFLRFTQNSGSPIHVAMDNLVFDQVPEPSTLCLELLGVLLGAGTMRRRS